MKNIPVERYWLDHLLATLAGVMGVYSVAMSIGATTLPVVLAAVVALAGIAGFGLSLVVEDTFIHKFDGWLFAAAALSGVFNVRTINEALPDGGFPFAIIAATIMFVLLVAGGLFAWRDSTLLFTTLPALVLFGLVGTIDTWRPGLFLFCALILCIALLYARVHQRTMIQWAEEGGADASLLHRDVWKWVAGPEYAFAAAGTIILLSFLGAPVVQGSLGPVSDAVRVNVSTQIRRNFRPPTPTPNVVVDAPIGTGPVNLSDRQIATVEIERPLYLRRMAYSKYSTRGWAGTTDLTSITSYNFDIYGETLTFKRGTPANDFAGEGNRENIEFRYKARTNTDRLVPTPGPVIETSSNAANPGEWGAGSLYFRDPVSEVSLHAIVSVPVEEEITAPANFPAGTNSETVASYLAVLPANTISLSSRIDRAGKTDYQQLYELKSLIARTCKYNTQAEAVPPGKDPVTYFLNESREGYCDLFASAFAVEARRMGYPSRYVTGYLMNSEQKQPDGSYAILEKHSHSWAEVYFEGYGWLPFDATEGAENITPTDGGGSNGNIFGLILEWLRKNAVAVFSVVGGLMLAGLVLLIRAKATPGTGPDANKALRHVIARFQFSLERVVGSPRRFSQTLREYIEAHKEQLAPLLESIDKLLPELEQAQFSAHGPDEAAIKGLVARVSLMESESKQIEKARRQAKRSQRK